MDINQVLASYLKSEFFESEQEQIAYGDGLLSQGIIDSIGMIKLISFIEQEFDIKVFSEDMTFDNFMSISHISNFIAKKSSATS